MYLRLRQICFVARDLAAVQQDLAEVFGLSACHRDPNIASFGLQNVLMPVGTSFFEIVSPIREATPARRYLDRRGGDGGYMAIFDSDEIEGLRAHVAALGVREAAFLEYDGFNAIQMHPKDTGGPLLEVNRTEGGSDLWGDYFPAGRDWPDHVRTERVRGIAGVEIQSPDPEKLARRWASILRLGAAVATQAGWQVAVDNAVVRFVRDADGRGEGLSAIDLQVNDLAAVRAAADRRGLGVRGDSLLVGGVRFHLRSSNGQPG
jgi:hypothetical protein